ncbi:hypothetical protein MC378_02930 [Polaribacter sp. MSW13]|uniref:Cytochrome C and Quinol oxidase polypeptide I n=1 Tax=Polaribacter marinus TaxID=2916838 RepID=A0A9X1VL06_9FLAO|nr:hypothetical protein [Polaribacter marinus]MCI2228107.1 hypothetical protein [Polaribacter marinus]
MIKANKQSIIALLYFFVAASLGIILRLFPITNVKATYKYIVHTHSHIALLGWVYIALTTIIYHLFIPKKVQKKNAILFWCTQFTLLGMLISFPITGYALFSIIFSTLFLISTYWFFVLFKKHHHLNKDCYSYKFINASLLFLIISSIGPWALGIIMNTLGNTSHWYKNAIYFYLHFQYNGWFLFCLFGVFIFILERKKIKIHEKLFSSFYKLMVLSSCLTLFLSFLWTKPSTIIYIVAFLGAALQLVALFKFQQILIKIKSNLDEVLSAFSIRLLKFIFSLFILKIVLQLLSSIPYFAELASQIVDFVIGYLHLTFLGIVSLSLFVILQEFKLLKLSNFWVIIYLIGFILSETLIFYKGFCNWQQISIIGNYYFVLVSISALIPFGILGILIENFLLLFIINKKKKIQN